jgi:hypothetical protein
MFQKAFSIDRKELLALGISTAKELRLYDEGEWIEHITRVEWDKQKFAREGVLYREDLKRMKKIGELEHIPSKANIKKIYFDTSGPLPLLSVRERIQELRIAIEVNGIGNSLAMCKWPGGELVVATARTVAELTVVQRRHFACFRMLQRILNSGNSRGNAQIVQDLQNLKCLASLHFRILKWQIESGQRFGDATDTQYAMKMERQAETETDQRREKEKGKLIKLTDFVRENCEDTPSISSKANRIHEFVKKGKITFMPKPVNNPEGNQTKLYREEYLRRIWPKLKVVIPSLPNLKG